VWPILIQKAFAKGFQTYQNIIFGNTLETVQEIVDCPLLLFDSEDDQFVQNIKYYLEGHHIAFVRYLSLA